MNPTNQYHFTAYITGSAEHSPLVQELREALSQALDTDTWTLDVVNVLEVPEKALSNDIFATPTIMRELPHPVVKVLANVARVRDILVAVIDPHTAQGRLV